MKFSPSSLATMFYTLGIGGCPVSQPEKEILEMFATYAKIANAEIENMHRRISKLEGTHLNSSPGLQTQLSAIERAIERLGKGQHQFKT